MDTLKIMRAHTHTLMWKPGSSIQGKQKRWPPCCLGPSVQARLGARGHMFWGGAWLSLSRWSQLLMRWPSAHPACPSHQQRELGPSLTVCRLRNSKPRATHSSTGKCQAGAELVIAPVRTLAAPMSALLCVAQTPQNSWPSDTCPLGKARSLPPLHNLLLGEQKPTRTYLGPGCNNEGGHL